KKDIIVTAGGKNIAPQNLENQLKTHRLISQVVVHGDQRKFLSALITLDPEPLLKWAEDQGLSGGYDELIKSAEVRAEIQKALDELNSKLPSYETIKKFAILDKEFSQESGELTPTIKIKRRVVEKRYRDVLDSFYSEA
ncbi:MAG: long-chain fatty acid--CoA ligase, partial [Myxococcota bacterium]